MNYEIDIKPTAKHPITGRTLINCINCTHYLVNQNQDNYCTNKASAFFGKPRTDNHNCSNASPSILLKSKVRRPRL